MLHLEFGCDRQSGSEKPDKEAVSEQRRLGLVCAEQISLAIANVKLRDQLRDQSIRDPLTGLFNRRYMLETCRREFSRAARAGESVSILSIDVDHFKKYNDNHGHDAGDTVLRAVANCMETCSATRMSLAGLAARSLSSCCLGQMRVSPRAERSSCAAKWRLSSFVTSKRTCRELP